MEGRPARFVDQGAGIQTQAEQFGTQAPERQVNEYNNSFEAVKNTGLLDGYGVSGVSGYQFSS